MQSDQKKAEAGVKGKKYSEIPDFIDLKKSEIKAWGGKKIE